MATFRWDASSHSGMALMLNGNTSAAAAEPDGSGAPMGETTDGSGGWLRRLIPLSDVAGSTVSQIALGTSADTPAVVWDTYYANMVILHSDGSVSPIFTGQGASGALWNGCGSVAQSLSVDTMATTEPEINTTYYLSDHLGTTQMELSSGGWPLWQGWFTPFGQELGQPTPAATVGPQNPDGASMRFKFTGKERDAESGLDYFGARYNDSSMGRFTSPDPSNLIFADPTNPQSLNLYAYVRNNPLIRVDPNGLCTHATRMATSGSGEFLQVTDYEDWGEYDCFEGGSAAIASADGSDDSDTSSKSKQHTAFRDSAAANNANYSPPCRGNNVGLTFGGVAEIGVGKGASLSGQASAMAGLFYDPYSGNLNVGAAGTIGGIGPGPVGKGNGSQGFVLLGALQGGLGLTFGNAGSVQSLSGSSTTYSGDIRLGGVGLGGSFSKSADGTWQFTINPPVFKQGFALHFSKVQSYTPKRLTFGKGCHG